MTDELYDHDVPLSMRADCVCGHGAPDHPEDLGGREEVAFACLRQGCACRNWRPAHRDGRVTPNEEGGSVGA